MHLKFRRTETLYNNYRFDGTCMVPAYRQLLNPYPNTAKLIERAKEFAIEKIAKPWRVPIDFEVHEIVYQADIGDNNEMPYGFNVSTNGDSYSPKVSVKALPSEPYMLSFLDPNFKLKSLLPSSVYVSGSSRPVLWAGQVFAAILRTDLRDSNIPFDCLVKDRTHSGFWNRELGYYQALPHVVYFATKEMVECSINTYRPELWEHENRTLEKAISNTEFLYICNSSACERIDLANTNTGGIRIQSPVVRPKSLELWTLTWGTEYLERMFGIKDTNVVTLQKPNKQLKKRLLSALSG